MTDTTISGVEVFGWEIPTEAPESDGTHQWDSTTIVVAELTAGGVTGLGWTYTDRAAAALIDGVLAEVVVGADAMAPQWLAEAMRRRLRNIGKPGIGAMAISAVDLAVWDLKARLMDVPLATLLGPVREEVPLYGSGGFTSYGRDELQSQLEGWADQGMAWVKMKVGRDSEFDPGRVEAARSAIGEETGLMVDANGAFDRREALQLAFLFADHNVTWYEEPVSSDDLAGLALVRHGVPPAMEVTAGEYAFGIDDFRALILGEAVDVLQADLTRCGGVTGLMATAELASAHHIPVSTHTAAQAHLHPACAIRNLRHAEWFHDHVRIESLLFEGAREPKDGTLTPDLASPGIGLELRRNDLNQYRFR